MEPASKTPLLHHKLEQILAAEDLIPGSHDYKAAVELFESFPKDELFQASAEELRQLVVGLLQLEKHGGIRVLVRRDLYGRSVSVVVALPRDRFNAALRKRLQQMFLERFHGTTVDYHLSLGETESARIFFTVHVEPGAQIPEVPYEELEAEVERLARSWDDDLRDALVAGSGRERGRRARRTVLAAVPRLLQGRRDDWGLDRRRRAGARGARVEPRGVLVGHRQRVGGRAAHPGEALQDRGQGRPVGVHAASSSRWGCARSRRSRRSSSARARSTSTTSACWTRAARCWTSAPRPQTRRGHDRRPCGAGETESDSLNRLVTLADLDWRQVQILRALRKYRMRVSARFTEEYRNDAMAEHPHISAGLVASVRGEVRPRAQRAPRRRSTRSASRSTWICGRSPRSTRTTSCAACSARSTPPCARTRTCRAARSLSIKLRSARCRRCPSPTRSSRSSCYSPHMEAIHLRGGMVARGGIRWSDRREDYRTEVLGLMKAQKVKNAVIVPDGSKGGFVLKRTPVDARGAQGGGVGAVRDVHAGHARHHRQPGRRRGRAPAARAGPRRRRPLPGRRRRQGHRHLQRHRERDQPRVRVLARRRVRERRLAGLRPQGARHHRPRRMGVACSGTSASSGSTS